MKTTPRLVPRPGPYPEQTRMNATNGRADHLAGREPDGLGRNQAPDSGHLTSGCTEGASMPRERPSRSRASCRGSVRGCAPQLPPRPGAAARFASRPERPASRLPAQPRRLLSPMRVSGPTFSGARASPTVLSRLSRRPSRSRSIFAHREAKRVQDLPNTPQ